MKCEFCNNIFSNIQNLKQHQRTAKYCISKRLNNENKELISDVVTYNCTICHKEYTSNHRLVAHMNKCIIKNQEKEKYEKLLEEKEDQKNDMILKYENNLKNVHEMYEKQIKDLQSTIEMITTKAFSSLKSLDILSDDTDNKTKEEPETLKKLKEEHEHKINLIISKYVKRIPRKNYKEKNVVYIMTTERLEKDRIYILGKSEDLTKRLSTYNKSDEHKVIFYKQCKDSTTMSLIESMIFRKLDLFRQTANRERFILPLDKNIDFFISTITDCVNFF